MGKGRARADFCAKTRKSRPANAQGIRGGAKGAPAAVGCRGLRQIIVSSSGAAVCVRRPRDRAGSFGGVFFEIEPGARHPPPWRRQARGSGFLKKPRTTGHEECGTRFVLCRAVDTRTAHDLDALLAAFFKLDALRPFQREAIEALLRPEGRVLLIAPTGGGKSLCYQLPALALPGVALVVSPLVALMEDQVRGLAARGIPATFFASTLPPEENARRLAGLFRGEYRIVYAAPERLAHAGLSSALAEIGISLVAIDEAHCIVQWGHDFRPDYLRLGDALAKLGPARMIACTATATRAARAEIMRRLGWATRSTTTVVRELARPNLSLAARRVKGKREAIEVAAKALAAALAGPGAGIVYAATRKAAEEIGAALRARGFDAPVYHGGTSPEERARISAEFAARKTRVLVATNAFGMGIDRPDVRIVVHAQAPASLDAYYQEVGRAGRDGKPARGLLLLARFDIALRRRFSEIGPEGAQASREDAARANARLAALVRYIDAKTCRQASLLRHFGDDPTKRYLACGICDVCLDQLRGPDEPPASVEQDAPDTVRRSAAPREPPKKKTSRPLASVAARPSLPASRASSTTRSAGTARRARAPSACLVMSSRRTAPSSRWPCSARRPPRTSAASRAWGKRASPRTEMDFCACFASPSAEVRRTRSARRSRKFFAPRDSRLDDIDAAHRHATRDQETTVEIGRGGPPVSNAQASQNRYKADLRELQFPALRAVQARRAARQGAVRGVGRGRGVDGRSTECYRFAREVLGPLNVVGDMRGLPARGRPRHHADRLQGRVEEALRGGLEVDRASTAEHGGAGRAAHAPGPRRGDALRREHRVQHVPGPRVRRGRGHRALRHAASRRRYFAQRMFGGKWGGTMCLTEPQAGTDVGCVADDGDAQRRRHATRSAARRSSSPAAITTSPRTSSTSCSRASTARRPARRASRSSSSRRSASTTDGTLGELERRRRRRARAQDGHQRLGDLRAQLRRERQVHRRARSAATRSSIRACRRCSS